VRHWAGGQRFGLKQLGREATFCPTWRVAEILAAGAFVAWGQASMACGSAEMQYTSDLKIQSWLWIPFFTPIGASSPKFHSLILCTHVTFEEVPV
jgi:hypothetical protein